MKWMIASDLHGSLYYCKEMLAAFEREQEDRLLLLGDLLYHGPRNDLPRDYAPKQVIPLLNEHKQQLLCVRGNCDAEVDQMVLEFPILADYAVLPVGQRLIYATHGHDLRYPRPCLQFEESSAVGSRGCAVARPHPCACLDTVRRRESLLQPRLGEHPQRGQPSQLYDAGKWPPGLEDHGG